MTNVLYFVTAGIIGYLFGSIPFGWIIVKLAGLGDVRKIGSHGTGATNVLRTGNKWLALATVLLDAGKGAFGVILVLYYLLPESIAMQGALLAGLFTVLGHNYPIWLKFKGGKGAATGFGVLLVTSWQVALLCAVTWLLIAIVSRYSSLASLTATVLAPIYAYFFATQYHVFFIGLIAVCILIRHQSNIKRLLKGEESKIKI